MIIFDIFNKFNYVQNWIVDFEYRYINLLFVNKIYGQFVESIGF